MREERLTTEGDMRFGERGERGEFQLYAGAVIDNGNLIMG